MKELDQVIQVARYYRSLTPAQQAIIRARVARLAKDAADAAQKPRLEIVK